MISDFIGQITDYRLQITGYRFQLAGYGVRGFPPFAKDARDGAPGGGV
jgi:hypothetical protein